MIDPIVEEVRKARQMHSEKHHNDLHEICKDIKEKRTDHVFVLLKPKYKVDKTGT